MKTNNNNDFHLKGIIKSDYIRQEELEPYKHLSVAKLRKIFPSYSEYKIKKSLLKYGWFQGKCYNLICQSCSSSFQTMVDGYKFCSNHCKHMSQNIWNRGNTKDTCDFTKRSSERMSKYNPSKFANYNKHSQIPIRLPTLGVEVTYDRKSSLEKEWLLQLDKTPGVKTVKSPEIEIFYEAGDYKTRRYYPDFIVEWVSGIRWLVEIKGVVKYEDLAKFKAATQWCQKNGYIYKLITMGEINRQTWDSTFCFLPELILHSPILEMIRQATMVAEFSPSKKRKVGCVIWTKEFNPVSFGFNSNIFPDQQEPKNFEKGDDGFLHAEEVALINLEEIGNSFQMAITHAPCPQCAKRILVSKKITTVYYFTPYKDMSGVGELLKNGVLVYKVELIDGKGSLIPYDIARNLLLPSGQY